MDTTRKLLLLPLLAATAFAFGCGSDSGSPLDQGIGGAPEGSMSFSFAGTPSGSFTASGPVHDDSPTWALARRSGNALEIRALIRRSATRGDMVFIDLDAAATGTHPIPDGADFWYFTNLHAVSEDFDKACWLETGSVNVTAITAQRVQGTFSGGGYCWDQGAADDDVVPFSITGGQFNAPFI